MSTSITKKTYAEMARGKDLKNDTKARPPQKVRFAPNNSSTRKIESELENKSKPIISIKNINEASNGINPNQNKKHNDITKTISNGMPDEMSDTVFMMLNLFLRLYNMKHQTSGCIFENINEKDPQSTNDKLETFYEYMQEHQVLIDEDKSFIDVYDQSQNIPNPNSHDVYAIIVGDCDVKYISLSYISLLVAGSKDSKLIKKKWNIIKLT